MGFLSVLKKVGMDFKKGLDFLLYNPVAVSAERFVFGVLVPGLGPMYNATATAVMLAEQKAAALGKQSGTGAQKLADVLQLMEPVIAQGLADAGKPNKTQDVINYINSVVQVLNTVPVAIGPVVPSVPSV